MCCVKAIPTELKHHRTFYSIDGRQMSLWYLSAVCRYTTKRRGAPSYFPLSAGTARLDACNQLILRPASGLLHDEWEAIVVLLRGCGSVSYPVFRTMGVSIDTLGEHQNRRNP
jgi:hypothetical protein